MNKNLLLKFKDYLNNRKNNSRRNKIFICLAMVVFVVTIYILMVPGITMEEVLICFDEGHEHTSECYGTDSDMEDITNLINMIEELPTVDEMNNYISEFVTEVEKNEYRDEIIATATILYSNYLELEDKVKDKIYNIDKLLEYNEQGLIEVSENSISETGGFNNNFSTFILKDNSSKLKTVTTADTANIVNINLYDYFTGASDGKGINDKFHEDNRYPGFTSSAGPNTNTITSLKSGYFNFSDMITTDKLKVETTGIEVKDTINAAARNRPLSGYIKNVLGNDGYPAIKSGDLSLKYLFSDDESYVLQQNVDSAGNTVNINGLFQYDSNSGRYYFDSRNNFAQFNSDTDTFSIYKQNITPNFMQYPFGNFLPLNNIKTQTTQVSTINRKYFEDNIASADAKALDQETYGDMTKYYGLVADRMGEFLPLIDKANDGNKNWDAGFVATQYFKSVNELSNITIETDKLTELYNIDFDEPVNFFFGMDMEMTFVQPKDGITGVSEKNPMIFEFNGDDDVYVYIDGILFLDLSGRHRHVGGKINFAEGIVTYHELSPATGDVDPNPYDTKTFKEILDAVNGDKPELTANGIFKNYSPHTFKFYYMERGSGSSVMKMNFNFPLVEKNSLMVTKELDDSSVDLVGNPDFSFQILKAVDGIKTNETFVDVGTKFDILDANGNKVDTGEVLENGVFKLKAEQTAIFKEISADKGNYYVREILDSDWKDQYQDVIVDGISITTSSDIVIGTDSFAGYESGIKDISDGHTSFVYTNQVDPFEFGTLKISKKLEKITDIDDVFKFKITIDNEVLPLNYKYDVIDVNGNLIIADKAIEKDCETCDYGYVLLSAGQSAIIKNILVGSSYKVEEVISNISGFDVRYENNQGEITYNKEEVQIVVTNISTGTDLIIPITKTIINPDNRAYDYSFKIIEMEGSSIDSLIEKNNGFNDTVVIEDITNTKVLNEAFRLKYSRPLHDDAEKVYYYKIEEIIGNDNNIDTKYDSSIYIIKVLVTNTDSNFTAKVVEVYKNGTNITEFDGNGNVSNIIEFINQLLVDFSITKDVQGKIEGSGEFEFEIEIIDNGDPISGVYHYQKESITENVITFNELGITPYGIISQENNSGDIPEEGTLIFRNGKANMELAHNEIITIYGIPYDAEYKVTELTTDGYIVIHNINSGDDIEGDTANGILDRDNTDIKFINIGGYLLPATGGSGTLIFGIIGLLLLIVPVIYIKYSFYKRIRSVV